MASAAPSAAPLPHPAGRTGQAVAGWLNLPRLFTLAILLALIIPAVQPVTDPDFWWHVTTGNWILAHHAVPHHDLYTYTVRDHRWITHEWLSEVILAVLFRAGGLPLVSLVFGLVTAAGFFCVFRAIDRRVNFVMAGLAIALGVAAANPIWGPRIQMITFALTALTYLWIQRFCVERGRGLYFLPLVMLVWANLHAGFFIAYAFLALAFAVELAKRLLHHPEALDPVRLRHFGFISLACVAVAVVNPNGPLIYLYPWQTQGSGVQQQLIVEWFSPNFHMTEVRFFEATIFLLLGGLALARRVDVRQFLLLVMGLGLALQSVRHLALFMIVAVPVLADYGEQAWRRHQPAIASRRRPLPANTLTFALNAVVLLAVMASVALTLAPTVTQRLDGRLIRRDFPVQAADFLVAHPPPGHMLNVYGWGGYLIFRLYGHQPEQPVFVYGDAAVTGDRLLQDYAHLQYLSADQASLLRHYDVNWVIFHSDDAIITELRQDKAWFELHSFGKATIMMRDTPANREYAASALP